MRIKHLQLTFACWRNQLFPEAVSSMPVSLRQHLQWRPCAVCALVIQAATRLCDPLWPERWGSAVVWWLTTQEVVIHRAHWLLAMQLEWQASQSAASQFNQLGKARHRRCWLEALHDTACKGMFQSKAESWGAAASDP